MKEAFNLAIISLTILCLPPSLSSNDSALDCIIFISVTYKVYNLHNVTMNWPIASTGVESTLCEQIHVIENF